MTYIYTFLICCCLQSDSKSANNSLIPCWKQQDKLLSANRIWFLNGLNSTGIGMSEPKQLSLTFDDETANPNAIYRAGDTVSFKVGVYSREPLECKDIVVKVFGSSHVHWSKGKNSNYSSTQTLLELEIPVFTPPAGNAGFHPPGNYSYPFSFSLPLDTAASFVFDIANYYISYSVTVKIHRSYMPNVEVKKSIIVVRDLDLNLVRPELTASYESQRPEPARATFHVLLNRSLSGAEVRIRLNKRGFAVGETIQVTGDIKNTGSIDFRLVTMEIAQLCEFQAEGRTRRQWRTVSIARLPPLAAGRYLQVGHLLPVPVVNCSYLQGSSNITINYFFRIRAAGLLTLLKIDLCELIIGSVPLGRQEPVQISTWAGITDELNKK